MTLKFHIKHSCRSEIKEDYKLRKKVFKLYPTLDLGHEDVTLDITIFEFFEEYYLARWAMEYFDHPKMGVPQYLNRKAMDEFLNYWESIYGDDLDNYLTHAIMGVRDLQISQELNPKVTNWLEPYITLYAD